MPLSIDQLFTCSMQVVYLPCARVIAEGAKLATEANGKQAPGG